MPPCVFKYLYSQPPFSEELNDHRQASSCHGHNKKLVNKESEKDSCLESLREPLHCRVQPPSRSVQYMVRHGLLSNTVAVFHDARQIWWQIHHQCVTYEQGKSPVITQTCIRHSCVLLTPNINTHRNWEKVSKPEALIGIQRQVITNFSIEPCYASGYF